MTIHHEVSQPWLVSDLRARAPLRVLTWLLTPLWLCAWAAVVAASWLLTARITRGQLAAWATLALGFTLAWLVTQL